MVWASIPHFVYRLFDAEDRLLYIGMTGDPHGRFSKHRSRTPWFGDAARCEWEIHPDRGSAQDAERSAIRRERPLHNIGSGRRVLASA